MTKTNLQIIEAFLNSKKYDRLTPNQQKFAAAILDRFNHFYEIDNPKLLVKLTPTRLKKLMLSEFSNSLVLDNKQVIAQAPVLRAFIAYLAKENLIQADKATLLTTTLEKNAQSMRYNRISTHDFSAFGEPIQKLLNFQQNWSDEFLKSESAMALDTDDPNAYFALMNDFILDMFKEYEVLPEDWTGNQVANLLEKIESTEGALPFLHDGLCLFIEFMFTAKYISDEQTNDIFELIATDVFKQSMDDLPLTPLIMEMHFADVDLDDPQSIIDYLQKRLQTPPDDTKIIDFNSHKK
ncbi:hypothetical protein [Latilactobacillus fuchuensis]|uniref:Uncharacterized protein n=1 Tax=Latilactobacillus fuchuensis TaxID=164393 RepID=A0A2N9DW59_9LACO|nr:hypothetical protein [Latilactobacillus fuchuensis]SPC38771.1 hypothetical protein LFUMFP_280007 [Latilactobacillus fuchuensis]